jgi:uncharacterized protein (TIGR00369 family)
MKELILEHLKQAVPFANHVGIELVSMGDGKGEARLQERSHGLNHIATHHAGALFTLAEAASGAAMAGTFASVLTTIRPVAATASIRYLRPARGTITAAAQVDGTIDDLHARLRETGKVQFRVSVLLRNENLKDVASMDVEWNVSTLRPAA